MPKKNYLYGEDVKDSNFYRVYTGDNYSFRVIKKNIKTLEGVFVSSSDLRKLADLGFSLFCRKEKQKEFETIYKGKFIPFEK